MGVEDATVEDVEHGRLKIVPNPPSPRARCRTCRGQRRSGRCRRRGRNPYRSSSRSTSTAGIDAASAMSRARQQDRSATTTSTGIASRRIASRIVPLPEASTATRIARNLPVGFGRSIGRLRRKRAESADSCMIEKRSCPSARIHRSSDDAAPAMVDHRVQVVEEPFVHALGAVEPNGVIEAGIGVGPPFTQVVGTKRDLCMSDRNAAMVRWTAGSSGNGSADVKPPAPSRRIGAVGSCVGDGACARRRGQAAHPRGVARTPRGLRRRHIRWHARLVLIAVLLRVE